MYKVGGKYNIFFVCWIEFREREREGRGGGGEEIVFTS